MFIKEVKKQNSKKGKTFFQYHLIQSMRVEGKPRQRNILYLGYHPFLEDKIKRKIIAQILEDKIYERTNLFPITASPDLLSLAESYYQKYENKYKDLDIEAYFSKPPTEQTADFEAIDVVGLDLKNSRTFGSERLCYEVLKRLDLGNFLSKLSLSPSEVEGCLLSIISRSLFRSSEHKTVSYLQSSSSLNELFDKDYESITHRHLYKISDILYKHKTEIDSFLYKRWVELFDLQDKLVIYDLSNSYFESRKGGSKLAKYGRNKQKRNDRPQVVFTGVINEHGFIRHSRIYSGNTSDSATMSDMLSDLQAHSSCRKERIVVIDAGIATEENLASIRKEGLSYVCVVRDKIKNYASKLGKESVMISDKNESPIELSILKNTEGTDRWMYVKSERKAYKERAMDKKFVQAFEKDLQSAKAALSKKGGIKKIEAVNQRIGRIKERHKRVQAKYDIKLTSDEQNNKIIAITWTLKDQNKNKTTTKLDSKNHGVYFIRTNLKQEKEKQLWTVYNTIRDVEATFRCLKTDLKIRPIYHQTDQRIEAHLYLSILAYGLVNTIRYYLKQKNIHYDWRNILRIMNTQHIATMEVKSKNKSIAIRKASRPNKEVLEIYKAVGISSMPKQKRKYVVYH